MHVTKEQMNTALARWRKIPTIEQFYRELAEDSDFKAALEAAYARDPNCMTIDAAGWRPTQYNVAVPLAKANENDPHGPGISTTKPPWWK